MHITHWYKPTANTATLNNNNDHIGLVGNSWCSGLHTIPILLLVFDMTSTPIYGWVPCLWWLVSCLLQKVNISCGMSAKFIWSYLPWFCGSGGCSWIWFCSALLCVSTTLGVYWYRLPLANRQVMATHRVRMMIKRSMIILPRTTITQQIRPFPIPQFISSSISSWEMLCASYKWRDD